MVADPVEDNPFLGASPTARASPASDASAGATAVEAEVVLTEAAEYKPLGKSGELENIPCGVSPTPAALLTLMPDTVEELLVNARGSSAPIFLLLGVLAPPPMIATVGPVMPGKKPPGLGPSGTGCALFCSSRIAPTVPDAGVAVEDPEPTAGSGRPCDREPLSSTFSCGITPSSRSCHTRTRPHISSIDRIQGNSST